MRDLSVTVVSPNSATTPSLSQSNSHINAITLSIKIATHITMDELAEFLKFRTGWNLRTSELIKLYSRYYDDHTKSIDYNKLMIDFREGILIKETSNFLDSAALSKQKRHLTFDQVIDTIYQAISHRIECLKGEDKLKKAYLLLGESRSAVVTRAQLKAACQGRLSIFFNDSEINEIFTHLDNNREGVVNTRQLINCILKRSSESKDMSLPIGYGLNDRKYKTRKNTYEDNQEANITYDKQFRGLNAPDPVHCRAYSIEEVESFIADRIFERSNLNDTMVKTTMKLFGDGENISNAYHHITLDMLRYTLWKRLKMNITDEDIMRFFRKYAKPPGYSSILMFDFIEGIVKKRSLNEPLLDNRGQDDKQTRNKLMASLQQNATLESFLILLRQKINDMINRESRAPHYLLGANHRMTETQTKEFLRQKLHIDLDQLPREFIEEFHQEYRVNGLIDIKRVMTEAMSIREEKVRGAAFADAIGVLPQQTLLNGALVTVDRMPSSLSKARMSPEKIEELIYSKCIERLKNEHPHASLHKMFREAGSGDSFSTDSRTITRRGLRTVFSKFDIIMSEIEFDAFFAKHDRGDGKIDTHFFLKCIMPPMDVDSNPFTPKDPATVKMEMNLAHVMEDMTGKRREVSYLNGIQHTRVEGDFLRSLKPPSFHGNGSKSNPLLASPRAHLHEETPLAVMTATAVAEDEDPATYNEQLKYADSLVKAMRDLPALAQQSPSQFSPSAPSDPMPSSHGHGPRRTFSAASVQSPNAVGGHAETPQKQQQQQQAAVKEMQSPSAASHQHADNKKARPKSANAALRPSSHQAQAHAHHGESNQGSDDRQYRLQQSEHLLALAEAYAQSAGASINNNNQHHGFVSYLSALFSICCYS